MAMNKFSDLFKKSLRMAKVNQKQFAALVGESPSTIGRIARGEKEPPMESLTAWATKLNLPEKQWRSFVDLGIAVNLPDEAQQRFLQLCDQHEHFHLNQVRGSMILADQVFHDQRTGKWVIAGTYDRWFCDKDTLHCPSMKFYIRLQIERPGRYPCKLWSVNLNDPPTAPKLWETGFSLDINEANLPVFQTEITLPGPVITAPVKTIDRKPGQVYALQTSIWLRVGQFDVASCPLTFIFHAPAAEGGSLDEDSSKPGNLPK